jgi:hypothetical protein
MSSYRTVLRNVGLVLIAIGAIDIALMIYWVSSGRSYSSSLNIFAVIAGIFLIKGSLKAAKIVTWFAAFILTAVFGLILVLFPLTQPFDLWVTEFRINPVESIVMWGFACLALAVVVWAYRRLRSPEVVQARVEAGQSASMPRSAFALGIALVLVLGGTLYFAVNGEDGAKAIELAKARNGLDYKYHVTGMHWSGSTMRATVAAYNDHESKSVEVEWKR